MLKTFSLYMKWYHCSLSRCNGSISTSTSNGAGKNYLRQQQKFLSICYWNELMKLKWCNCNRNVNICWPIFVQGSCKVLFSDYHHICSMFNCSQPSHPFLSWPVPNFVGKSNYLRISNETGSVHLKLVAIVKSSVFFSSEKNFDHRYFKMVAWSRWCKLFTTYFFGDLWVWPKLHRRS